MMHSNSFVLAVKGPDGRILRELGGKVFLPFHSEYSLLLKNMHSVRACCSVTIDGTDVLGGDEIIIPASGSTSLERFLADGNLTSGKKFKFVPLSDSKVQDPSSPENGIIEVRFWKEKQPSWLFTLPRDLGIHYVFPPSNTCSNFTLNSNNTTLTSASFSSPHDGMPVACCAEAIAGASAGIPGATVEGSASSQNFSRTSFEGKDGEATVLRLTLMGREEPLTVCQTKIVHCGKCGVKNPFSNNFCRKCGVKLQKSDLICA